MPQILYIIGNGFDLWHDIPSTYLQFHSWLKTCRGWKEHEVEKYFRTTDLWSDLERELGKFNYEAYGKARASFEHAFVVEGVGESTEMSMDEEVEKDLAKWRGNLLKGLSAWVKTLVVPANARRLRIDSEDALFLSFNYTRTLEDYYRVNPAHVLHIHGQVGNRWQALELGHGGLDIEPSDSYEEYVATAEVFDPEGASIAVVRSEVESWRKPVEKLIAENHDFWERLNEVTKVYVLGFACSDIDMPYIRKVAAHVSMIASWYVSYYKGEDRELLPSRLYCAGANQVTPIRLDELCSVS